MSICISDEAATERFGAALAMALTEPLVIHLSGELGAGKTTLVRGLLRALGHTGPVNSPTYTLVEPYELESWRVSHFDLYRLSEPEELEYLGFRDYIDGQSLCLIEWPERAASLLPSPDLVVTLTYAESGRKAEMIAFSPAGQQLLTGAHSRDLSSR